MEIKIKLNDEKYRYDVYQMFNIFFTFQDISFVKEGEDFCVSINGDYMELLKDQEILFKGNIKDGKKEEIKKSIFTTLSNLTGEKYPWGTMIGIRPSKRALKLINEGVSEEEIVKHYSDEFLVEKEKAQLCIEVAKYEEKFVNKHSKTISIYVGMPFCPTRCLYCSFASNPIGGCKKQVDPYLEALSKEISLIKDYVKSKELIIETVYFGGGTPTAVDDEQFEDIMRKVYESFVLDNNIKEFTVECGRPDSITAKKLQSMKKYSVDRISINPQSMNDLTLKEIGRNHTVADVIDKFNLARSTGFDNINMDIIVGLPNEGLEQVENTYRRILELNPESLTVHGMSIKRSSRLHENLVLKQTIHIPRQEELNKMYNETKKLAEDLGMHPYYMYRQKNMVGNMENVGYSKVDKECIYNIQMIEDSQTIIALGADAVSKVVFLDENRIERFGNVKDVKEYINRIDEMIEGKIALFNTLY
ncbi:coproporphyrinogen III oxidase [Clostridium folliculivorans]|uniref:Coproporphyrinogen III oxidase n=1 Tax=Clostridium folliculivorans TaxID=2886038 RepID=A0A9W5XZF8_9CLOT|nr:coproporphyrinogen III oxidase [Clostridium folliculivorans]GKU23856.1 coproporphyrinogen III oxidase [Clostridium folliculivorans]GKU29972.1 coproporphyrinogen III oxidase [Clostridium folliculivorans]